MATVSNGIQQRTRTKAAPAFPRERQQQQQQQQQQQHLQQQQQQQHHSIQPYFLPHTQQHNFTGNPQLGDLETWRLQSLHSAPVSAPSHPPRRSSRGPKTASPTRSVIDPQTRTFTWDQQTRFAAQQHFRRKSITSTSSSDHHPHHNNHHHQHLRSSRSPSPATPHTVRNSLRTPMPQDKRLGSNNRKMTGQSNSGGNGPSGCCFETALVNSRRRIPYSMGSDILAIVPPDSYHAKLDDRDERCLSVDILDLCHQLLPTEDTEDRRRLFIEKLNKILNREFPNCYSEVHVFGSSENRLGTNSSDVDVCVVTTTKDMDNTYNFEKVVCVAAAKVPVVKIWDAELNIQCDINVNNSLAIENTRLIKVYVDIDERVRPLAMIIKYWAKSRLLNDAAGGGTLTSYTWILMVINFLQTRDPPILPSLQQLPHRQRLSNGIDVGFCDDFTKLKDFGAKNVETLGGLLYAFFVRFAFEFDYNHDVISVRTGGSLPKEAKGWHLMQNNSLCVEEPFNISRNLGNTADEATVKGLQLEFRRAVHYLADHASLEAACSQFQFPTSEHPRPERHLPHQPQYRHTAYSNNNFKKTKHVRPQNFSPPFKSPKSRALEDPRNFNSYGSRQPYPFNPLNLNHPLPPQVPIPSTPQSSMSSNMSPPGDMHHAYPPTPLDQLHYIDPFKNRQVAYYIPAFAPNGLPVYVPYTEDPVVYASPPQTPAMSETSLSHQPQYPRTQPFVFPHQYPRGQSVQRGRQPHRGDDVLSPTSTFRDPQPLTGIGITTPSLRPPYIPPPPMKRRNSLPANNKPNVPSRPNITTSTESFTTTSSQGLAGSMSSVGDSDVFEEEFFNQRFVDELPVVTETPRPSTRNKSDMAKSPGTVKESPGLPAGKSYAAALLNAAPIKSPIVIGVKKETLASPVSITDKEKRNKMNIRSPSINVDKKLESTPTSPIASPLDNRRGSTIWNNLHPAASTPTSPTQARRPSIQSITSNSPKKPNRSALNARTESQRNGSIVSVPEPVVDVPASPAPGKKRRKPKTGKKKDNSVTNVITTNGILNRRQSVTTTTA